MNSSFKIAYISGLKVAAINYKSLLNKIEYAIKNNTTLIIYYANFYSVNLVTRNLLLRSSFNNADIVHPDGIGIWLASKFLRGNKLNKFNWTDNGLNFLKDCEIEGWSIYFLGSSNITLNKAVNNVKKSFPKLKLVGFKNGYDHLNKPDLIDEINSAEPDILWVGIGTPKQELWIDENRDKLKSNVIHSVGDFFTFLAGEKKRGPKFIQSLGFEWMVRVIYNPRKYFGRYVIGIPKFFFLLIVKKIRI